MRLLQTKPTTKRGSARMDTDQTRVCLPRMDGGHARHPCAYRSDGTINRTAAAAELCEHFILAIICLSNGHQVLRGINVLRGRSDRILLPLLPGQLSILFYFRSNVSMI